MWWTRKGHPSPYVFTLEELRQSADVFAIELWDIKSSRKVLFGEDVFDGLDVPMGLHRIQVERELRASLVRLRQRYLTAAQDRKSTRLNSSHGYISYAVFCLKKKKKTQ